MERGRPSFESKFSCHPREAQGVDSADEELPAFYDHHQARLYLPLLSVSDPVVGVKVDGVNRREGEVRD